jgi:hypothetical protein
MKLLIMQLCFLITIRIQFTMYIHFDLSHRAENIYLRLNVNGKIKSGGT